MAEKKTLHLSLKKKWFDLMVTGEKIREFRSNSKWIRSRLLDPKTGKVQQYKLIKFVNGYGNDKPYFICKFRGAFQILEPYNVRYGYSDGSIIETFRGDWVIQLGKIIEIGNYGRQNKKASG